MKLLEEKKMENNTVLRNRIISLAVITLVVATYAWTWIRGDWQNWYQTVQDCVSIFAIAYFALTARKKEKAA